MTGLRACINCSWFHAVALWMISWIVSIRHRLRIFWYYIIISFCTLLLSQKLEFVEISTLWAWTSSAKNLSQKVRKPNSMHAGLNRWCMHYIYIFCSIRSPRRLYKMLNSTKLYIERRPPSRAIIMMVQASRMPYWALARGDCGVLLIGADVQWDIWHYW